MTHGSDYDDVCYCDYDEDCYLCRTDPKEQAKIDKKMAIARKLVEKLIKEYPGIRMSTLSTDTVLFRGYNKDLPDKYENLDILYHYYNVNWDCYSRIKPSLVKKEHIKYIADSKENLRLVMNDYQKQIDELEGKIKEFRKRIRDIEKEI